MTRRKSLRVITTVAELMGKVSGRKFIAISVIEVLGATELALLAASVATLEKLRRFEHQPHFTEFKGCTFTHKESQRTGVTILKALLDGSCSKPS